MSASLLALLCSLLLLSTCIAARPSRSSHRPSSPRGTGVYDNETAQLSSSLPYARDACNGKDYGTSGQFDFYVLAQSWSPEYCHSRGSYPGCQQPTAWQQTNLTLHGIWPQYAQQTGGHPYPQCCDSQYGGELTEDTVQSVLSELQLYWPNEEALDGQPLQNTLWYHEWAVHGTCSGLPQLDFFQLAFSLVQSIPTPAVITDNVGGAVQLSDIEAAYNGGQACAADSCYVWVECSGAYLIEVHTCWDTNGQQVVCPQLVVSASGQCKDGPVQISAFSAQTNARDEL